MHAGLKWVLPIWIFFLIDVCTAKNLNSELFDWSNRFHQNYFDLSNDLPGHEAHVDGLTSTGEKCRLETFKEGSGLSVALYLLDSQNSRVEVDARYDVENLSRLEIERGTVDAQNGKESLKILGNETGGVH